MSSNNQSLAMQRIAKLVDENSFMEIGSLVTARSTDFNLIFCLEKISYINCKILEKILANFLILLVVFYIF